MRKEKSPSEEQTEERVGGESHQVMILVSMASECCKGY